MLDEQLEGTAVQMPISSEYPETQIRYPAEWADEYKRTLTVASWNSLAASWFPSAPHSTVPGTLDLFAQYALMQLLAEGENIHAITWMYLAHVDDDAVERARTGEPWVRPNVKHGSKNAARIASNWDIMHRHMGDDHFDKLQEAIVRAGFSGFSGEPDLFCYDPSGSRWFFAEAKGRDQLGEKQTNATVSGWFDVALKTLGERPGQRTDARLGGRGVDRE